MSARRKPVESPNEVAASIVQASIYLWQQANQAGLIDVAAALAGVVKEAAAAAETNSSALK